MFSYPGSVSVLDQEAIEDYATSTIADLFTEIPGIAFGTGPRRTGNVPTIRGIEGEGVLVLFDGIRQDFISGHDGRFFIDPDLLRSVEVVRGPGSALYGSSAVGGVIAFQTLNANDVLSGDEQYGVRLKAGYQDVFEEYSAGASVFARSADGRYDGVASITYRDSGDIELGTGDSLQADDEIYSGLLKGTARITDDLTANLTWITFNNTAEEPNNGQGANVGDLVEKTTSSNTIRGSLAYNPEDNNWINANLIAYGAFNEVEEDELDSNRSISRDVESYGIIADNRTLFQPSDDISVLFTYGAEYYENEQIGEDNTADDGTRGGVPDAESNTVGLFFQAEISANTDFGTWTLIPGVRYDRFENEADGGPSTDDDAISPRIGLSYQPTEWLVVYGSYAEAFRAPSFNEIFADGVHFTIPLGPFVEAPNFFIPNPDLEPETSKTFEFGAGLTFGDVLFGGDTIALKGGYFESDVENLIDLDVDLVVSPSCFGPGIPGPCTSGTSQNVNTRNATLDGVEIEAQYDAPRFFLTGTYASIDGENQDTGDFVGILTPNRFTLNGGIKIPEADLRVGARAEIAEDFDKANNPAEFRDSYQVYDIYLVWTPSYAPLDGFRVDFGVDNVTDAEFERVFAGVPEPGRNVKGIVRWEGTF